MERNNKENDELILIPKCEKYMQYMIEVIFKIPRTEKFNISIELIGEIGKIVGGLLKYYGKNFKE